MDVLVIKSFLLFVCVIRIHAEIMSNSDNDEILPRYVVFPGLDAGVEEVDEWYTGFASPFNVFFGPKPYILGWVGEDSFVPGDDDEGIEGEGDYEEEEEEIEPGEEPEEELPDYDYEKS